jgi:hypothetical protein
MYKTIVININTNGFCFCLPSVTYVYLLQDHMSDNLSGSTPQSAVAAATAAAAAVGSTSNSTGTPRHADGRHSSDSARAAALMQSAEPAGPASAGRNVSNTNNTAASNTFTSSEYDDLAEDIVSDTAALKLSDLEAKLDIISPEDLTVSNAIGAEFC